MNNHHTHHALIFTASDFDEGFVANCLTRLWENDVVVNVVAPTRTAVTGRAGLTIFPDMGLEDVSLVTLRRTPHLLVFPGNHGCVSRLLTDPRVYTLVDEVMAHGGSIAAVEEAARVLAVSGRPPSAAEHRFLKFCGNDHSAFVQRINDFLRNYRHS